MKKIVMFMCLVMILGLSTFAFAGANDPVQKDDKGWYIIPCGVGGEKGVYNRVVRNQINRQLKAWKIRLDPSYGGTTKSMEDLKAGEIPMAIVQGNGPIQEKYKGLDLESLGKLHKEYIHFAVKRGGKVNEFSDIGKEHTIAIGSATGGSAMTWGDFVNVLPKLKDVSVSTKKGTRARKALENGTVDAWFAVTGVPDADFMAAAKQKLKGKKSVFELVEMDKGALDNWKFNGERVYEFEKLDDDVYPGMIDGMSVKSLFMKAQMIANVEWIDNNEALYEKIVDAVDKARPGILKATDND